AMLNISKAYVPPETECTRAVAAVRDLQRNRKPATSRREIERDRGPKCPGRVHERSAVSSVGRTARVGLSRRRQLGKCLRREEDSQEQHKRDDAATMQCVVDTPACNTALASLPSKATGWKLDGSPLRGRGPGCRWTDSCESRFNRRHRSPLQLCWVC